MDSNLYANDWEQLREALVALVVMSFVLESALAIFIKNKYVSLVIVGRGICLLGNMGIRDSHSFNLWKSG